MAQLINYKIKTSLALYFWLLYALCAVWPLNIKISDSSYLAGQIFILIFTFLFLIYDHQFKIIKTKDDHIIIYYTIFIFFNCLLQATFQPEAKIKIILLRSMVVSLLIILPYFVARSTWIANTSKKDLFINVLFAGLSFFVIYKFLEFSYIFLKTGNVYYGRSCIAQRIPVILNFIFLMALLMPFKSKITKIYALTISAMAFILIIISLTRGAYLSLILILILLIILQPKKGVVLVITLLISLGILYKYKNQNLTLLFSARDRFKYMLFSIKNPRYDNSASTRLDIWREILRINFSSPINFAFGSGEMGIAYFDSKGPHGSAHSDYFDVLIRRGLIGLLFFLLINYRMTILAWKLRHNKRRQFYISLFIGFSSMAIYNLFEESFREMPYGIFFFVIYGILVSEKQLKIFSLKANN